MIVAERDAPIARRKSAHPSPNARINGTSHGSFHEIGARAGNPPTLGVSSLKLGRGEAIVAADLFGGAA
jgi:hypothetical protein